MSYDSYADQLANAQRRRAMAEAMYERNLNSEPTMQTTPGGMVVPYSPFQGLAKIASAVVTNRRAKKAQDEEDKLRSQHSSDIASAVDQYRNAVPDSQVGNAAGATIVGNALSTAANPPTNYVQPQPAQPRIPMGQTQATNKLVEELAPREQVAQMLAQRAMKPGFTGKLGPGDVAYDNGRQVASVPAKAPDDSVDYVDLGDKRTPVSHRTGQPTMGLASLTKGMTPGGAAADARAQQNKLGDDEGVLAGELYKNGVPAPSGGRGTALKPTLRALLDENPNLTPAEIAEGVKTGKIKYKVDMDAGVAPVKAAQSALAQNEKLYAAASGYANTLDKNLTDLEAAYAKLPDQSPVMNKISRNYAQNVTGDPDTASAIKWLNDVTTEYAKLSSGAMGNAPASDTAQAHARETINKYMTQGGIKAVIAGMRKEKENRISSIRGESDRIRGQLQNGGAPPEPAAQPGAAVSFGSEAEADAAARAGALKPGTKITINGVSGTWQ